MDVTVISERLSDGSVTWNVLVPVTGNDGAPVVVRIAAPDRNAADGIADAFHHFAVWAEVA